MKAGTIALTLALCSIGVAAGAVAADPNLGTWKLNAAKSKIAPGRAQERHGRLRGRR